MMLRRHQIVVLVVLLTAVSAIWLAGLPSAARTGVRHRRGDTYVAELTVASRRVGRTDLQLDVHDRAGRAVELDDSYALAVMPRTGHVAGPVSLREKGSGRYRADAVMLMMPGSWEVRATLRGPDGEETLIFPLWITG